MRVDKSLGAVYTREWAIKREGVRSNGNQSNDKERWAEDPLLHREEWQDVQAWRRRWLIGQGAWLFPRRPSPLILWDNYGI